MLGTLYYTALKLWPKEEILPKQILYYLVWHLQRHHWGNCLLYFLFVLLIWKISNMITSLTHQLLSYLEIYPDSGRCLSSCWSPCCCYCGCTGCSSRSRTVEDTDRPRTGTDTVASAVRTSTGCLLQRIRDISWSFGSESNLPRLPKLVMMSVKKVRKRGDAAAKYEILTVSSILLVRRTRKTKRGTTRKL